MHNKGIKEVHIAGGIVVFIYLINFVLLNYLNSWAINDNLFQLRLGPI